MKKSLLSILSNTKTRTLVLLSGGVLITGVIVAIVSAGKTGEPLENKPSKTAAVPTGIESTPGAKTSERYRELQQEANLKGAQEAEKTSSTFVPTIVGGADTGAAPTAPGEKSKDKNAELQKELLQALDSVDAATNKALTPQAQKNAQLASILEQQKIDEENENKLREQRLAEADSERMAALNEQRLRAVEQVAQAMEQQTQTALKAWNEIPLQQYVAGTWNDDAEKRAAAAAATEASSKASSSRPVSLKAGSIMFAVLETAINSDEPGPIMARIVQGKFKDGKLIGAIEVGSEGEKISLKFDTLSLPSEPASTKISAVAIDPDNARTALASDVDHHYFLRWGSLFASAFLEGYSKAVSESGTSVQTTTAPGSSSTTTNKQALSGRQQVFEGLGKVGERWSEKLGQNFERKPTITIDSGISIGVLVTADLKLGEEPNPPPASYINNSGQTGNDSGNSNTGSGQQSGNNSGTGNSNTGTSTTNTSTTTNTSGGA